MAWVPSTRFEDDLVDLQPNHNLVHGQLSYEAEQKQDYVPRPQAHYDYLANRQTRNEELENLHGPTSSKSKEIRSCLEMMELIQQISGTKPLGEHATMADWDDRSTVEQESIAMMRHFGMMSMADGALSCKDVEVEHKPKSIHIMHKGRRRFPLILDTKYFEPRKLATTPGSSDASASTYFNVDTQDSSITYDTAQSNFDTSEEHNKSFDSKHIQKVHRQFNANTDHKKNNTKTSTVPNYGELRNSSSSGEHHSSLTSGSNDSSGQQHRSFTSGSSYSDMEIPYMLLQDEQNLTQQLIAQKKKRPSQRQRRAMAAKRSCNENL